MENVCIKLVDWLHTIEFFCNLSTIGQMCLQINRDMVASTSGKATLVLDFVRRTALALRGKIYPNMQSRQNGDRCSAWRMSSS